MDQYIEKQIRRTNRNLFITGIIFILGPLVAMGGAHRYFYNFFFGPFPMDVKTLLELKDPKQAQKYFITTSTKDLLYSGNGEIEKRTKYGATISEKKVADYYVIFPPNSDQKLLVRMGLDDQKGKVAKERRQQLLAAMEKKDSDELGLATMTTPQEIILTGELKEVPLFMKTKIFSNDADFQRKYVPYILDTADHFRTDGYIGIGIGGFFFLLGTYLLILSQKRGKNTSLHPIAKELAIFGELDRVSNQIEMELQRATGVFQLGSMLITPSWLFQPSLYGLRIVYLENLVWMYEQIIQNRTNGIPTGKNYKTILWAKNGKNIELVCRKGQATEIMTAILQRVPWIMVGYNEQLKSQWALNRAQFLAEVNDRKNQILSVPTSSSSL